MVNAVLVVEGYAQVRTYTLDVKLGDLSRSCNAKQGRKGEVYGVLRWWVLILWPEKFVTMPILQSVYHRLCLT